MPDGPPPDGGGPGHGIVPPPLPVALNPVPPPLPGVVDPTPGYMLPMPIELQPPPPGIGRMATFSIAGGVIDVIYAIGLIIFALIIGIGTDGLGFVCCVTPAVVLTIGIMAIMQGAAIRANPERPIDMRVVVGQIAAIVWCNPITPVLGLLIWQLSKSDDVTAWYKKRR